MSIFEIIMLICFGMACPFSIYKSWKTKENGSKSLIFLTALIIGYISGIIHKILYNFDGVIFLYILNAVMVFIEIIFFIQNKKRFKL
ncbi:MAG: hypothetical protein J7L71_05195 [Spirochaetaceae bacterium]|nr:hypothetical protein [Spirochaetaceae bacterium]